MLLKGGVYSCVNYISIGFCKKKKKKKKDYQEGWNIQNPLKHLAFVCVPQDGGQPPHPGCSRSI